MTDTIAFQGRPGAYSDLACRAAGSLEVCAELEEWLGPEGTPALDGRADNYLAAVAFNITSIPSLCGVIATV